MLTNCVLTVANQKQRMVVSKFQPQKLQKLCIIHAYTYSVHKSVQQVDT